MAGQIPLVAFHNWCSQNLFFTETPLNITRRLREYMASSTVDSSGEISNDSAPRVGVITFWDMKKYKFLTDLRIKDGCGAAATEQDGTYLITAGTGQIVLFNVYTNQMNQADSRSLMPRHWDNHLTRC